MTESQTFWPSGNLAETAAGIDAYTEIASYAYPPGERQRYKASGWQKAVAAGFANLDDYEIIVTADLEEHTWGRAYEGRIYLNRSAFQAGTKIVAGTLIEEYIHLKHRLHDESRDLQNHLVNALVSMCELARGEPL